MQNWVKYQIRGYISVIDTTKAIEKIDEAVQGLWKGEQNQQTPLPNQEK